MKTLNDLKDVRGKLVLLRLDLNVPVDDNGHVTDTTRIDRVKDTVLELQGQGARVALFSYLGRPNGKDINFSLSFMPEILKKQWGVNVSFIDDCLKEPVLENGDIALMENVRFYPEEHDCTPEHTAKLAGGAGEIFVFDAFSVAHRNHCSIVGLAHALPAYAGRALQAEMEALESALGNPDHPVVAIVGGAKISTKLDVLNNLVNKVDVLILGGGMANTFLYAAGADLGQSLCEKDMKDQALIIMEKAQDAGCALMLPLDGKAAVEFKPNADFDVVGMTAVPDNRMILDIGDQSITAINQIIDQCKTLVWNGPFGVFEMVPFDGGTVAVAQHVAARVRAGELKAIAGGGDTVSALAHAGVVDDMTYVSTAGGAFLEWLEGKDLPAIAALDMMDEEE